MEDNPAKKKETYWKLTANRCQTRHENERISGKLYVQVPIQTWHIPIPTLTYPPNLLFRYPHPSPSSRVASYFVNCIDAFSLYSLAEGERETEDFACSAYRTASFRVLHIPQTNQRLSSSFLCNRWWTDGISFNEIFSFARLIYFPVNRMSIVFSLPLLNFRDRNSIVSLFHRWSINFNKFSWNERIVTV